MENTQAGEALRMCETHKRKHQDCNSLTQTEILNEILKVQNGSSFGNSLHQETLLKAVLC